MKTIFLALGALTCTAAGAAVGVFATRNYYYERSEEEIASMRESCRELVQSTRHAAYCEVDALKDAIVDLCDEQTAKEILKVAIPFDTVYEFNEEESEESKTTMKTAYHTITSQLGYQKPSLSELSNSLIPPKEVELAEREYPKEEEDEEDPPEEAFEEDMMEHPKENPRKPYRIKYEDMGVDENGRMYDIDTLMYYSGDDTLCDEDERILQIPDYVGSCLDDFRGDVIYVRNEKLGMDFEIVWSDKAYANVVMGYIPDGEDEMDNPARKERRRRE